MKFARCFLKGSDNPLRWIDYPIDDSPNSFASFVTTVRINGGAYPAPNMPAFVPWDEIKFIIGIETGAPMFANIVHEAPGTTQ
jgi:hypothetical protein